MKVVVLVLEDLCPPCISMTKTSVVGTRAGAATLKGAKGVSNLQKSLRLAGAGVNAADTARKSVRPAKILAGGTKALVNVAGLGPKMASHQL